MKHTASSAVAAALLALFCVAASAPGPALAQEKAAAQPAAAKMVKKRAPSKMVMDLQKALNGQGAKLKVDGFMGRKTRAALKKYQAANKLKASGMLDKATRAKLKI